MAENMVQHLHFRILKFPLVYCGFQNAINWGISSVGFTWIHNEWSHLVSFSFFGISLLSRDLFPIVPRCGYIMIRDTLINPKGVDQSHAGVVDDEPNQWKGWHKFGYSFCDPWPTRKWCLPFSTIFLLQRFIPSMTFLHSFHMFPLSGHRFPSLFPHSWAPVLSRVRGRAQADPGPNCSLCTRILQLNARSDVPWGLVVGHVEGHGLNFDGYPSSPSVNAVTG